MSKARSRAVQVTGAEPQPTEGAADTPVADTAPPASPARSGLPLESEVDPYSIDKAVMTQSGWVCPAERRQPRNE